MYDRCGEGREKPVSSGEDARINADDTILVVESDETCIGAIEAALVQAGEALIVARSAGAAIEAARQAHVDIAICSLDLPGELSARALAEALRESSCCTLDLIMTSRAPDLTAAIASLQDVDADFLRKPFSSVELLNVVRRARERRRIAREHFLMRRETDQRPIGERVVGESEPMREVWRIINRIASTSATVLIKGETGTGKELAARALHDLSGRKGSFVAINCAAISPELIESELFGHVKGAFTGALSQRPGLFCHADSGTLFLDEIGEMPLAMQAKLLRVLEQRTYRPVGGNRELPTTARVVAATNRDLAEEVEAGRFRKDLFFRINVMAVRIPPLRERRSDIERLARLYLSLISAELGLPMPVLEDQDIDAMRRYDWPGNIRELRNVVERSLLLGKPLGQVLCTTGLRSSPPVEPSGARREHAASLREMENSCIIDALRKAQGNKTAAARLLGISRKTVERRLRKAIGSEGCG